MAAMYPRHVCAKLVFMMALITNAGDRHDDGNEHDKSDNDDDNGDDDDVNDDDDYNYDNDEDDHVVLCMIGMVATMIVVVILPSPTSPLAPPFSIP